MMSDDDDEVIGCSRCKVLVLELVVLLDDSSNSGSSAGTVYWLPMRCGCSTL
jgi:hypothetical protein